MSQSKQPHFISWRFHFILAVIFLLSAGLLVRVVYLAVFDQTFLLKEGKQRYLRLLKAPTPRGMITDRNGDPLAVSTSVFAVWFQPKHFSPNQKELYTVSALLQLDPTHIHTLARQSRSKKREFVYLKRGVTPDVANKIKMLHLPGLFTQEAFKRFYPEGEVAAHVVGFTNVDDRGQEGIELAYNDLLTGEEGKQWVVKDRLGRIITNLKNVQSKTPAENVTLSIDKRIQYIAYRELLKAMSDTHAKAGSAVVLDVETGEVLAIANQPSFNPNNPHGRTGERIRNRALTDVFEPGSTMKAFSIASAIDSGKYHADTMIDTTPGWLRIDHHMIGPDEHHVGRMTVREVLQISSNVGVTKIILSLPPNQLWNVLHKVGFGENSGVNFPGEQSGSLVKHDPWGSFMLATLAFGYGMSVNTLQLARAYAVIAHDGLKLPVTLIKQETPVKGERVMRASVANEMKAMLETVVSSHEGTGFRASVPGYRVAGKTGTAKIAKPGGYEDQYMASFVGMAPVSHPKLVVAVVLNNPIGLHQGGEVSAPVFSRIMQSALNVLNVSPDDDVSQMLAHKP